MMPCLHNVAHFTFAIVTGCLTACMNYTLGQCLLFSIVLFFETQCTYVTSKHQTLPLKYKLRKSTSFTHKKECDSLKANFTTILLDEI